MKYKRKGMEWEFLLVSLELWLRMPMVLCLFFVCDTFDGPSFCRCSIFCSRSQAQCKMTTRKSKQNESIGWSQTAGPRSYHINFFLFTTTGYHKNSTLFFLVTSSSSSSLSSITLGYFFFKSQATSSFVFQIINNKSWFLEFRENSLIKYC